MISRLLSCIILSVTLLSSTQAQTKMTFDLPRYDSDTLLLAYYYADKILVADSLFGSDGHFEYERDTLLPQGMYVIVEQGSNDYHQILVGPDDQTFSMSVDPEREIKIIFDGSAENELFYSYIRWLEKQRTELNSINEKINGLDPSETAQVKILEGERDMLSDQVQIYQRKIIADHPSSLTALMIAANMPFEFPEFTGTEQEIETQKYKYYKQRYFDNAPLGHPALLRTPLIHERVEYYLEKLTPQTPDSVIQSVDRILDMMSPAEDTYKYYLSNLLSKYGNSKFIGMDAVYVHLALDYYGKGKAPWIAEENLREIVSQARKVEPTLIGKKAPEFSIKKQDGTDVSLSDFDTDYTVLMFWKPDCGHCTKAMPYVLDFNEKYKDKSVSLLAVCTKTGKDYGKCWDGVEEKNMGTLLNAGDEFHRSRIFSRYNVTTTPLIYIIDKAGDIRFKKVPAESLDQVMEEIMKIDAAAG